MLFSVTGVIHKLTSQQVD